jgi:hypothetical protein
MTNTNSNTHEEDKVQIKQDYRGRLHFWTGETLTQFGTANNLFIAIGIALLGYFIKQFEEFRSLSLNISSLNPEVTFLVISTLAAFMSVICGIGTLLSRLYDLRLSRHKNTTKVKGFKKKFKFQKFESNYIDIRKNHWYLTYACILLWNFFSTVVQTNYYIIEDDFTTGQSESKFQKLHERTLRLGSFSWMNFGWQIFWISISIIGFLLTWIFGK